MGGRGPATDSSEWDGNAAMTRCDSASCYQGICAGRRSGEASERGSWALPHHKSPGGPANAAGVRAARARFEQTEGLVNKDAARSHLFEAHSLPSDTEGRSAPIEMRAATLGEVSFPKRVIEVVAVPYGGKAIVEYRGELWEESIERGAFDGIEKRPNRIKAVRDHDKTRLVGKAVNFWPSREEGLVGEFRIASTPLGDETLTLADEGMLDVSAGFAIRMRDQILNKATHKRTIKRAFLDHLAFVANGAYEGAQVLAIREQELRSGADLPPLDTPKLDEVVAWLESRRTS